MEFEQVKAEILELIRLKDACFFGYKQAEQTKAINELLKLIKDEIDWYSRHSIATAENLEKWFGSKILQENHVYISGNTKIIVSDNAYIIILGNACVDIQTAKNSKLEIKVYNNGKIKLTAKEHSSMFISVRDNSSAIIETYDNSSVNVTVYNSSFADAKNFDQSKIKGSRSFGDSILIINNERK